MMLTVQTTPTPVQRRAFRLLGGRIGRGVDRAQFEFTVVSRACVEKAVRFGIEGIKFAAF
jgi:hypothetical protein